MKFANKLYARCVLSGLICLAAPSALAHEFIVKPDLETTADETLSASVMVTEVYMQPDRMPPATTKVHILTSAGQSSLRLAENADDQVLQAEFSAPDEAFILIASSDRTRPVRSPDGGDQAPGVQPPMLRMDAFAKTIFDTELSAHLLHEPAGMRLEILPQESLAGIAAGDTLKFRVLFDGSPVTTRVQATFDGHTADEHGYVVRTESNEDGIASVTFTEPGLWIIRTKVTSDQPGNGYDQYEASSNLVFPVAAAGAAQ